jgi:uncharacterized protein
MLLLLFTLMGAAAFAQAPDPCFPPKPKDEGRLVFQYTAFLDRQEEAQLNDKLVHFARETSNRIAVVAVDSLCGYPPSDYAFQLGEAWGFGKKGIDNGVLILVKPNGAPGTRHVFIAVGYGLEGAIPDLTAKRIVDEEVLPRFRQGDLYGGMDRATEVLMALAKGEINAKSYGEEEGAPWGAVIMLVLFTLFILFSVIGRTRRYARTNSMDFWTAMTLMNAASNRHGGSWGGFSGGGGIGGGGGFGGFGGGGFGGGGAGGSW